MILQDVFLTACQHGSYLRETPLCHRASNSIIVPTLLSRIAAACRRLLGREHQEQAAAVINAATRYKQGKPIEDSSISEDDLRRNLLSSGFPLICDETIPSVNLSEHSNRFNKDLLSLKAVRRNYKSLVLVCMSLKHDPVFRDLLQFLPGGDLLDRLLPIFEPYLVWMGARTRLNKSV